MLKRTYDWVLGWAHTKYGTPALFLLSVAESSFFPIPPDVLLMALSVSRPKKSLYYALITTIGSVIGGVIGYIIGLYLMEAIGNSIIELYGLTEKFAHIQEIYRDYDAWAVGVAGFTPIPYKVFTISAGVFKINFLIFIVASAISRGARFFIVGWLVYRYGQSIKGFIEKYFNILSLAFIVLLILGFAAIKFIGH